MSEKNLRKYVGGLLEGHNIQVESHATSAGVPDTNGCQNGYEYWIELKYTTTDKKYKVRPTQMTWFRRRVRAGATNCFILWRYDDEKTYYGLIHVTKKNIEKVFSDTSPSFWALQSVLTWAERIQGELLNMHLRGGKI